MQMLMYVSNLKLKTVVFHFCLSFVVFSLVLAMAPKNASAGSASSRKRGRCEVKGFIPVSDIFEEPSAEAAEAPADTAPDHAQLAPFVECKTEEGEDEATPGARRATKGNGMNPLEVSRMLTMLGKRRKKDHACMRMCNTYHGI